MKKIIILCSFLCFFASIAQNASPWKITTNAENNKSKKITRNSQPSDFKLFTLDVSAFKNNLIGTKNGKLTNKGSNTIIELPNAEGVLEHYQVYEMPIMEDALAAKYPTIKSYAAQGIEDPTAVARFCVTQLGLHSMTLSGDKSTVFIDPYTEDKQTYIVYSKSSLTRPINDFECLTNSDVRLPSLITDRNSNPKQRLNTNDKKLRTYRLALSCTAEYGNVFAGSGTIAQQKANIQAQMVVTMTRVNGVYEKDLAITMIFIANNDALIFLGDTTLDPWDGENNIQTGITIDATVGFSSYDIGHNFRLPGGGNAGCIGCVAGLNTDPNSGFHKGTGYTGRPNPTGDAFDIDYVAHEMGHQFGGFHTQSNASCRSGNSLTEVETGSGSSIMGYAGTCSANVQNQSDAYFAYVNIRDISDNIQFGVSSNIPASQITNFANNPPTANAGRDFIVPISTPFILEGSGTDPDGNTITYNWEQNDPEAPVAPGVNAAPTATRAIGPMFRSKAATASPIRYMPALTNILTGATSNTWEVLPSVTRDLNFSLTVRDNVATGGQTASDLMKVTVSNAAGPFVMTVPNTNVSWTGGSNRVVTWTKANTDIAPVNAKYVDIYMSQNNGTTFPILLASKVPNDGSETVSIPNTAGSANRIMVRGHKNIFLDVSNTNFTTTATVAADFKLAFNGVAGEQNKPVCQSATSVSFPVSYEAIAGFSGVTTFTAAGVPANATVSFSPATLTSTGTTTMTVTTTSTTALGVANIIVTATSGALTKIAPFYLEVLSGNFVGAGLTNPTNNAVAVNTTTNLAWNTDANATSYDVQVASDIAFTNIIATGTSATTSFPVSGLAQGTNYYWRVLPKNMACTGVYGAAFKFETGIITCQPNVNSTNIPLTISSTAADTVNSTLNIPSGGTIADVNVSLNLDHSYLGEVTATLISPAGTQVQLFKDVCGVSVNALATFDDTGSIAICGSSPTLGGVIKPSQLLSAFNGQSSAGNWNMRIVDSAGGDGGILQSWNIEVCTILSVALKNVDLELKDFALYPNPNNGSFNLRFSSASANDVKINVHDMRGRRVFEKSFSNNGSFNQDINLNRVEAGIYLVTISDGDLKTVKRIIVQ